MCRAELVLGLVLAGCGTHPPSSDGGADPNAIWDDPPAASSTPSYRTSLAECWTSTACQRAMLVTHGGDWDLQTPYDSRPAFVHAVQRGSDGIKGDFRLTSDGVGVVAHSSPIELFESVECVGKLVEQLTADEVTACHLIGSTSTFQRVDRLLAWARGRTVVMLDVKRPEDLVGAIRVGLDNQAQDFLFYEVHVRDFESIVVGTPGWDQLHYLVWLDSPADADRVIAANHAQQGFMFEMDPTYAGWDATAMQQLISSKLHPAGIRAFTSTDSKNPTAANHQALYDEGFDVVMTYSLTNGLPVRQAVNTARGVSPP